MYHCSFEAIWSTFACNEFKRFNKIFWSNSSSSLLQYCQKRLLVLPCLIACYKKSLRTWWTGRFETLILTPSHITLRNVAVNEEQLRGTCSPWSKILDKLIRFRQHLEQSPRHHAWAQRYCIWDVYYTLPNLSNDDIRAASTGSIQEGQQRERISQSSIQSPWNVWWHGRNLTWSPTLNSTKHIAHLQGNVCSHYYTLSLLCASNSYEWFSP